VSPNTESPEPEPPAVVLGRMAIGHWVAQALFAAIELRIPELLAGGPATAADLAQASDSHPEAMLRLLRGLAAHGVVSQTEDGRFEATPISEQLRRDLPGTLGPYVRYITGPEVYRSWGDLLHSVRTGETALDHVYGVSLFEFFDKHPDQGLIFDEAMTSSSGSLADQIVEAYDFSRFGTVVDVGGGQGMLLSRILRANPRATGVLFDLPTVVEGARPLLEREGVADRCRLVGGSFFESVPDGGDAYVIRGVLHDWDDERTSAILATCRAAMGPSARLLVIDRVIPDQVTPTPTNQRTTMMDLNMLILAGGHERTLREFESLFAAAGFALQGAVATPAGLHVIEGTPSNR
jgi:hypothetical protein